jgi:arylsulfatase
MGPEIYGVKWRDFKLVLIAQKYMTDAAQRLPTPRVINLVTDPQEREPVSLPHLHSWTATHFNRILGEFHVTLRKEPLTPAAAPLNHVPHPPRA